MGFFKKVGKALRSGVKSVGKVAKSVVKSTVGKVATKALGFVKGMNPAKLLGKAFSFLGKGLSIQNWLKSGLGIFGNLKNMFRLTDVVKNLLTGPFQPLGMLSKMAGGLNPLKRISDFAKVLQPRLNVFKDVMNMAKQARQMMGKLPSHFIPKGWADMTRGLNLMPGLSNAFLQNIANPTARMQSVFGMMTELMRHLETSPMAGRGPFIRA